MPDRGCRGSRHAGALLTLAALALVTLGAGLAWQVPRLGRAREPPPEHFEHVYVPLPVAVLVGLSLVLAWEAVHPRRRPVRSTIARQASGHIGGLAEEEEETHERTLKHEPAAAALRSKMSKISHWAPRRNLMRASTVYRPPKSQPARNRYTTACTPTRSCRDEQWRDMEQWRDVEASSGPLASRPLKGGCVIFFAEHTVATEASSPEVQLTLFRVGDISGEVSVTWSTMDGTALAGEDYVEATGPCAVHFPAGESVANLHVRLLPGKHLYMQRFFIVHTTALQGRATMGGLPFARVRLLETGAWPPGFSKWPEPKQKEGVQAACQSPWSSMQAGGRLVAAFVRMLVLWRGRKYGKVVGAIVWKDLHHVVLNTLLLNFALYDLCLTKANEPAAYRRLLIVVCVKFVLVLLDRLADHVVAAFTGAGPATRLVQSQILHRYLELRLDPVELGHFYHLFFDTATDAVNFAYKPTFKIIHSSFTLLLSFLMALAVPMLRGNPVSPTTLKPLFGIAVLVPLAFVLALPMRRRAFEALVQRRREAHAESCGCLQDVLACRWGLRAYDGSFPAQQVALTFDHAYELYGGINTKYAEFRDDTQWVAKYLGELAKLMALLFGGFAALHHARTGSGTMTLGQFAVIISLYGAIIGALYDFIEAYDGMVYARILLEELSSFFDRLRRVPTPAVERNCLGETWPSIQFDSVHLDMELEDEGLAIHKQASSGHSSRQGPAAEGGGDPLQLPGMHGVTVEVPLGCIYAITSSEGWSSTRRYVGTLLGGAADPTKGGRVSLPGLVRQLAVMPPASPAAGTVLENLLSYAADWVRGSDVLALTAILGVPFEAPPREKPLHDLRQAHLLEVLRTAVAACSLSGSAVGRPALRHLSRGRAGTEDLIGKSAASFRARMAAHGVTALSQVAKVMPLLRQHELLVLDLVRGLLADPDVLVVQDILACLPGPCVNVALQALQAWQRLGGLRGMVSAWERARIEEEEAHQTHLHEGYPAWLTEVGGLCRTVVLSEGFLAKAGVDLRSHVDALLEVGLDRLEVAVFEEADVPVQD